jgi:hypothetical protein
MNMPCEIYLDGQSVAVFDAGDDGGQRRSVQVALMPALLQAAGDHWLTIRITCPVDRYRGFWRGAWLTEYIP